MIKNFRFVTTQFGRLINWLVFEFNETKSAKQKWIEKKSAKYKIDCLSNLFELHIQTH